VKLISFLESKLKGLSNGVLYIGSILYGDITLIYTGSILSPYKNTTNV